MTVSEEPNGWNAGDMLMVLMRGGDGEVTGILSVDEPADGQRPDAGDLESSSRSASRRHRDPAGSRGRRRRPAPGGAQAAAVRLDRIADARSDTDVLEGGLLGIRDALGLRARRHRAGRPAGTLLPAAAVGWDALPDVPVPDRALLADPAPSSRSRAATSSTHIDALRLLDLPDAPYVSQRTAAARGPGTATGSCVPLRDPNGALRGLHLGRRADRPTAARHGEPAGPAPVRRPGPGRAGGRPPLRGGPAHGRPRRADRPAQPRRPARAPARRPAALAAQRADGRRAVRRPRPLQDDQRHPRPRRRRRGAAHGRRAAARRPAPRRHGRPAGRRRVRRPLREHPRPGGALEVARRIRARLSEPMPIGTPVVSRHRERRGRASRRPRRRRQELLRFADVAMYRAKAGGRDAPELASDEIRAGASARAQLERALAAPSSAARSSCTGSPSSRSDTGRVLRVEALMRWHAPRARATFRPWSSSRWPRTTAASSRWAAGRWRSACAQWGALARRLRGRRPAVAVNLSPRQLRDSQLVERGRRGSCANTGWAPAR